MANSRILDRKFKLLEDVIETKFVKTVFHYFYGSNWCFSKNKSLAGSELGAD